MITKLTPAQQTELRDTYTRWLAIGRGTAPLDRPAAIKAIGDMYEAIGEKRPPVLFFSSPLMCILAYGSLRILTKDGGQLWDQLRGQLWDQLRDQLWDQLWGQLWGQLDGQLWDQLRGQLDGQLDGQLWGQLDGQLWDQLRGQLDGQLWDQLWDQLRGQLWGQLWDQLRGQLDGQLWDQLWDQLRGQLRDQLRDQLWGQLWGQLDNVWAGPHWCAWEVFYDFCNRIGVTYTSDQRAKLDLWMEQSRACHWWWPYKGLVIASERHTAVRVDEQGRLNNLEGPAVEYSDGWNVYAVHGLRVDPNIIINRHTITPAMIDAESNNEIRRVLIEIYGDERYLLDSGAVEVQSDEFGTLYRKAIPGDEDLMMVKVVNATCENCQPKACSCEHPEFKNYYLRVPPRMERARQAIAWTWGKQEHEYSPLVQT